MTDVEAVEYLMAAYFHQDWVLDGGDTSDTVSAFLRERRDLVARCADQIDELLATELPEGALQAKLADWGSDYYAGDTDDDYRAWLEDIRKQIRTALTSARRPDQSPDGRLLRGQTVQVLRSATTVTVAATAAMLAALVISQSMG